MRATFLPIAALLALLAGTSPAAAEGKPVRLTITSVKAAKASEGRPASVGPGLERVASKLQKLPFERFESDGSSSQEIGPGEKVTLRVPFGGSGRFEVAAKPLDDGSLHLEIAEYGPGADKPCLSTTTRVEAGRTHVTFCDGVPAPDSTTVFLLTVQ